MVIKVIATGSKGNCYLIVESHSLLLLECGIPFDRLKKALDSYRLSVTNLDGVLVSHEHGDHCKSFPQLVMRGVNVYMLQATASAVKGGSHHRVHPIEAGHIYQVGEWRVLPFNAEHDVPCCGYFIGHGEYRIFYLSDSMYSKYKIPIDTTHLMLGVSYAEDELTDSPAHPAQKERIKFSHMSLETVERMIEDAQIATDGHLREVHLLHLSDRHGDPEKFLKRIQALTGVPVYVH